jgi:hypothetical protein
MKGKVVECRWSSRKALFTQTSVDGSCPQNTHNIWDTEFPPLRVVTRYQSEWKMHNVHRYMSWEELKLLRFCKDSLMPLLSRI